MALWFAMASARYTFRGNLRETRYGWLRLTPAYSVELVRELVTRRKRSEAPVLDPFCGTGTTLVACAELGVACDTIDLNPFLVWLAKAKSARYDANAITEAERAVARMARAARSERPRDAWRPPLHKIERWWSPAVLDALARAFHRLDASEIDRRAADLARLAFCRALMETSNASFRHQSMSFSNEAGGENSSERVATALERGILSLASAAEKPLQAGGRRVFCGDSRDVAGCVRGRRYGAVVTSPPYANRMSYIRELRPYMYWLGYLSDGRAAGQLDWKAIGGTWGAATSNLSSWSAPPTRFGYRKLSRIVDEIAEKSALLARYVERYFCDMRAHLASLDRVLEPGAEVHYVVGNSKFYDVIVPVERILEAELRALGFNRTRITTLRKRTSKRELYEYCVSATAP